MIAFLLMLAAILALAEYLSLRLGLDSVEYDVHPSKTVAEPDEPLQLITVIVNRRRRFLPFIRLNEDVPDALDIVDDRRPMTILDSRGALVSTAYMLPRQKLTRRTDFSVHRRGRFQFQGATLESGDFLGLRTISHRYDVYRELVILPRSMPSVEVGRLMGGWMGERSVNRFIMEDPVLTLGYRDYTGREPVKQISWMQTARMGRMMVRCQDYTVERTVTVMLNACTTAFGTYGAQMLEGALSLCRGVCEALEEKRIPYSFMTNAQFLGASDGFGEVGDGLGLAHLHVVLEGLGRADFAGSGDRLDELFDRALSRAGLGRGHVFITPVKGDLRPEWLEKLRLATGEAPLAISADQTMVGGPT